MRLWQKTTLVQVEMTAMIVIVFLLTHVLSADKFPCDITSNSDIISGPLPSYSWTCDNIVQCLDGTDEAGCGSCSTGRIILKGIPHDHESSWLNGVYTRQDYKIYNKAVWQSEVGKSYIYHNGTEWVVGTNVGEKKPLLYSTSAWTTLFGEQAKWRYVTDGVELHEIGIVCVTESVRKCFGTLSLTSINSLNKDLTLGSERALNRPIYSYHDNITLRYVMISEAWNSPHWQVAQKVNGNITELIVFLDNSLHPGYITSPGLELLQNGKWVRGSNIYLKCSDQKDADTQKDADCVFSENVCNWEVYRGSKFKMVNGPAETSTKGTKLSSTLYIVADKNIASGKYRLTSPEFDVSTDSCVVMRIALSGSLLGSSNVTLTRVPLTDAEQVIWSSDQIDADTIGELNYNTVYIDLVTGDRSKLKFQVLLGQNDQMSGTVSVSELAVFEKSCQDVDLYVEEDPCWSMPCQSGDCIVTGLKTFICSCPINYIGDRCEIELTCTTNNLNITNTTSLRIVNNILFVECQPGYVRKGDLPICGEDGWSSIPKCEVKVCEVFEVENGVVVTDDNSTEVIFGCNEGYLLVGEKNSSCALGIWSNPTPKCLKSCPSTVSPGISLNSMVIGIRKCTELYKDDYTIGNQNCTIKNVTSDNKGIIDNISPDTPDNSNNITSLISISLTSTVTVNSANADTLCVTRAVNNLCVSNCSYRTVLRIRLGNDTFLEFSTHFAAHERISGASRGHLNILLVSLLGACWVFLELF